MIPSPSRIWTPVRQHLGSGSVLVEADSGRLATAHVRLRSASDEPQHGGLEERWIPMRRVGPLRIWTGISGRVW